VTTAFLLQQGGTFYRAGVQNVEKGEGWKSISLLALNPADFEEIKPGFTFGTSLPDFSSSGAPIRVGYWSANFSKNAGNVTQFGVDNFEVTFHSSVIPEPSALALLGIGAVSLFGYGRWRKRWNRT